MSLPKVNPTRTAAWQALLKHFEEVKDEKILSFFEKNKNRANDLSFKWEDFYVDVSKNRLTTKTLRLLLDLAEQINLKQAISSCFSGDKINETEDRAVLHTALRNPNANKLLVDGLNIVPQIHETKLKIKAFTDAVVSGEKIGYTGKAITTIVNIGIGGSDLGPAMVVDALQYYKNHLTTYFVSNVDGDHVNEVVKKLDPETTLFVIVSKTFTTQETLSNANTLRNWFLQTAPSEAVAKHFVAVSTNIEKVKAFGISEDAIFPMWNWVGGRFSLWSAVGLSISLSVGYAHFESLLDGAYKMDMHFKNESFDNNIPVILALIGIWYTNFFNAESEAVIAYSQYLNQFASYLQQASMESNGKSIDRNGNSVKYQTGSIVWGEPGTNSQHAFFQLIHQGTKLIPADFIGFTQSLHGNQEHQDKLMSNFIAQTEALLNGKTTIEVLEEFKSSNFSDKKQQSLLNFKIFEGNKPTNTIFIKKLTPQSLGKLVAMYEHKIFVQGVIWNVFSFDQYGVELGKQLANTILAEFDTSNNNVTHDPSTTNLIAHYKSNK